jgi:probable HAF family extracellular repeat protein
LSCAGAHEAFYWNDVNGASLTLLGAFQGGKASEGSDVNAAKNVVGWAGKLVVLPGNGPTMEISLGFYYDAGGTKTLHSIGSLGGPGCIGCGSAAYGINDQGLVVGWSQTYYQSPYHAIKYDMSTGTMTDLGTLSGGDFSWAWKVNEQNDIVGYSNTSTGSNVYKGFLLLHGTATMVTVPPPSSLTNYKFSEALDLDDSSTSVTVVGWAAPGGGDNNCTGLVCHAIVYRQGDSDSCDLDSMLTGLGNNESWRLEQARAIDSSGFIVGAGSHTVDGVSHRRAFLLSKAGTGPTGGGGRTPHVPPPLQSLGTDATPMMADQQLAGPKAPPAPFPTPEAPSPPAASRTEEVRSFALPAMAPAEVTWELFLPPVAPGSDAALAYAPAGRGPRPARQDFRLGHLSAPVPPLDLLASLGNSFGSLPVFFGITLHRPKASSRAYLLADRRSGVNPPGRRSAPRRSPCPPLPVTRRSNQRLQAASIYTSKGRI